MLRAFERMRATSFAPALACVPACSRVVAEFGVDLTRARARCGFARGHLIDVVVYVPGGLGHEREQEAAEELVWLLVGAELFERWIGKVSVTPSARGGPLTVLNTNSEDRNALPVSELCASVRAAIEGVQHGLAETPPRPTSSEDWVLFELEPEPAEDYAAQDDLVIVSTRLPELKKSFLRGEPFFSGRFSCSGELFAYLKYESRARTSEARLAERGELEAALAARFRPDQAAVFGTGLGLRYAYLDFVLRDPRSVEDLIIPVVRAASEITRGWVLFCDAELEREWLGVHEHTPEPFWG